LAGSGATNCRSMGLTAFVIIIYHHEAIDRFSPQKAQTPATSQQTITMPSLRSIITRSASTRHKMVMLKDDDFAECDLPIKSTSRFPLTKKRSDQSMTEVSCTDSEDMATPLEFVQFDVESRRRDRHCSKPVTPRAAPLPEKKKLGTFLDRERVRATISETRTVTDKNGRPSKGRSRRVSSSRSVASMPTARVASTNVLSGSSRGKSQKKSRRVNGQSLHSSLHGVSGAPKTAPTGHKKKVSRCGLPLAPQVGDHSENGGSNYRKARSTRELLKEYNTILDDFGDSTRGPRSKTQDLLEEYDHILTECEDSARADRKALYHTGWN
jgi:hypothetical protein